MSELCSLVYYVVATVEHVWNNNNIVPRTSCAMVLCSGLYFLGLHVYFHKKLFITWIIDFVDYRMLHCCCNFFYKTAY